MAYRIERINSEMLKSLSVTIQSKLQDPRVAGLVNVTKVDCAKDLKTAKVYLSAAGEPEEKESVLNAVRACASFIRRELANDFKDLRTVPSLTFILDESGSYGSRIDRLLAELKGGE